MGQAVGAGVELGVAQAHLAEGQRRGIRGALHLGLDQLLDALLQRVLFSGGVPRDQGALALGGRQQRQFGHRLVRLLDDALQQVDEVGRQPLDGRALEQVGGIDERRLQSLWRFAGLQGQVQLGHFGDTVHAFDLQVAQARTGRPATAGRLVVEHHLKQRVEPQGALRRRASTSCSNGSS